MRSRIRLRKILLVRIGNYFQEAAVLVGVFGLMEKIITNQPVSLLYGFSVIGLSLFLFLLGYILEV